MIAEEETADRCGVEISWNLAGDMQKQTLKSDQPCRILAGPADKNVAPDNSSVPIIKFQ